MKYMDKKTMAINAGAGVGIIQALATRQYDITIPYLPSNWNKLSSTGNIIIGGIAFGLSAFTKILNKNENIKNFLTIYGMSTLIGGLMNGLFPVVTTEPPGPMKANMSNGRVAYSPQTGRIRTVPMSQAEPYYSDTYYPKFKGTFYKRPMSKAQGFASDVTVNPKAAIPTEIPENKFLA